MNGCQSNGTESFNQDQLHASLVKDDNEDDDDNGAIDKDLLLEAFYLLSLDEEPRLMYMADL